MDDSRWRGSLELTPEKPYLKISKSKEVSTENNIKNEVNDIVKNEIETQQKTQPSFSRQTSRKNGVHSKKSSLKNR